MTRQSWSRDAVIYQVYVRSFADGDGDGVGDLLGIASRLDYVAELGVDAVWLTPFYPSPMADGGYDVADYRGVDPCFGTLADFDKLLVEAPRPRAQGDHRHRAEPLLVGASVVPGRPRRRARVARAGAVPLPLPGGDLTVASRRTTGSRSSAVRPGPGCPTASGTCTCSPASSPTSTGTTPRCGPSSPTSCGSGSTAGSTASGSTWPTAWSRRPACPTPRPTAGLLVGDETPFFDQDGVHEIYREWRSILDGYTPERIAVAEAWLPSVDRAARYVRPGELHQAFNFDFLGCGLVGAGLPPGHRRLARRDGRGRRAHDLGHVQSRRGAPRVAAGRRGRRGGRRRRRGRRRTPQTADPGARPAPGPGGDAADAGPARLGLPLPGRGARPARGVRPARRCPPGPGLRPYGRGRARPRRLPGAAAVVGDAPAVRLRTRRLGALAAAAGRRGPSLSVQAQRDDPASTLSLYRQALRLRRERLAPAGIEWRSAPADPLLAFVRPRPGRWSGASVW